MTQLIEDYYKPNQSQSVLCEDNFILVEENNKILCQTEEGFQYYYYPETGESKWVTELVSEESEVNYDINKPADDINQMDSFNQLITNDSIAPAMIKTQRSGMSTQIMDYSQYSKSRFGEHQPDNLNLNSSPYQTPHSKRNTTSSKWLYSDMTESHPYSPQYGNANTNSIPNHDEIYNTSSRSMVEPVHENWNIGNISTNRYPSYEYSSQPAYPQSSSSDISTLNSNLEPYQRHLQVWSKFFSNASEAMSQARITQKAPTQFIPLSTERRDFNNQQLPTSSRSIDVQTDFSSDIYGDKKISDLERLFRACQRNDVCTIQRLISHGVDINSRDSAGRTAVHFACRGHLADALNILFSNGAEIETKDFRHRTPLHVAAEGGNLRCLQFLLQSAVKTNSSDKRGDTPLHLAARAGRTACVSLLLEYDSDSDIRNRKGQTPLKAVLSVRPCTRDLIAVIDTLKQVRDLSQDDASVSSDESLEEEVNKLHPVKHNERMNAVRKDKNLHSLKKPMNSLKKSAKRNDYIEKPDHNDSSSSSDNESDIYEEVDEEPEETFATLVNQAIWKLVTIAASISITFLFGNRNQDDEKSSKGTFAFSLF
jgi:hypothetical protein